MNQIIKFVFFMMDVKALMSVQLLKMIEFINRFWMQKILMFQVMKIMIANILIFRRQKKNWKSLKIEMKTKIILMMELIKIELFLNRTLKFRSKMPKSMVKNKLIKLIKKTKKNKQISNN